MKNHRIALRRILSVILATLFLAMQSPAFASNPAQNQTHWANQSLLNCLELNLLDQDATYDLDAPVSPDLFSDIFNKAFDKNVALTRTITRSKAAQLIETETGVEQSQIFRNYPDGWFYPDKPLTTGETCALIIRLVKILNAIPPADERAWQIIQNVKTEYPTGTLWGFSDTWGTNYYYDGVEASDLSTDVSALNAEILNTQYNGIVRVPTSVKYACGGFAAMISDRIFGKVGHPCREIFKTKNARPGDIVYFTDDEGYAVHIAVVYGLFKIAGQFYFQTAGANEFEQVRFPDDIEKSFCQIDTTTRVFTRFD